MTDIRLGVVGRIERGDDSGSYVRVISDADNTGGFLIITSATADFSSGFDDWVEDWAALESYFDESGWAVRWIE